ncbi:glycosyltransferase family 4 protein [Rubrolithibacter danxiaensis]|uniref:glycosyltransferase family 4 protein n=1 Tax=Rubrolithibacter danxiaensis TaxID=3390805 RepID=UPI003BF79E70
MFRRKAIIIHPGTQHAFRLANGLTKSERYSRVSLFTWLTLPGHYRLGKVKQFKKRVKNIDKGVAVYNFPFFEAFMLLHKKILILLGKQNNNPYYFWYRIFNWFMLPYIYFNRRGLTLVLFETAGWPLSYFAKRWGITVIMDFPSISHEKAMELGIKETALGIRIKEKERQYIDFALFCSSFAAQTYRNRTSAKKDFVLPVGADVQIVNVNPQKQEDNCLRLACIANMEFRKGIDILLLAFSKIKFDKELHLIGKINKQWVLEFCRQNSIDTSHIIFSGSLSQGDLNSYLIAKQIDLHVLPSRFDSFGMVVPETMILGIPNILSPFVGAGELIEKDQDGFIMDNLTPEDLFNKIRQFRLLSFEDKVKLQKNVINKSATMTWDNYYGQVGNMVQEVLSEKRTGNGRRIAFIVTHPTQFEVPFFQFVSKTDKVNNLYVFYLKEQNEHFDSELKQKINWGFNLYEGYEFTILDVQQKFKKLEQQLTEHTFDLVILNGYKGLYNGLNKFFKSRNIPVALRLDSVLFNNNQLSNTIRRVLLKTVYRTFDGFFATGSASSQYLAEMRINENKIHYFYYCTDNDFFAANSADSVKVADLKERLGIRDEKVILSVAKFNKRESPEDIIRAFGILDRKDITLILAGDGEEREGLEQLAGQFPQLKIVFTGYVPYTELAVYYGISDLFVHSAQNEPWGVSVQEALASGCKVIASDRVGAAFDLVRQGRNGYIYPYGDVGKLAAFISESLDMQGEVVANATNEVLGTWNYSVAWNEILKGASKCQLKN